MNTLVINGSPKGGKSNSYRMTEAFVEGIGQALDGGACTVEELVVNRLNIKPCIGCFSCWNKTPGTCCLKDDMAMVIEKMLWADVIIWSFPLYYFSVPGGLKNLIDRQLPMVLPFMTTDSESGGHPMRYDMSGKRHVVISTCGFYTSQGNYEGVTSMFDHMCQKGNYTTLFCGQGELFRVPELHGRTDEYLGYVRAAGAEYISGGISEATQAKLDEMLFPRETFEQMADSSWGIDRSTGEKEDPSLSFTRQMASLYRKDRYGGKDIVLEINYTDVERCYQVVLDQDGSHVLTDNFRDYTTKIETPLTVWRDIAAGKIAGDQAMMDQKYRVLGDFDLMLKWDDYFGGHTAAGNVSNTGGRNTGGAQGGIHMPAKGTNMTILLIPWIVFWVAAAIDGYVGALVSIAACALVPVLFYQYKKTIYDMLSVVLVCGCSILLLTGADAGVIVPLSYLGFGVMWTVSCFTNIPLTAHYSMNNYNGERALKNPLFMKTNRILTLLWGILYLFTPIWTYFMMMTSIGSLVGAINSVLPGLMGIFTAWFRKWYPAKVARG